MTTKVNFIPLDDLVSDYRIFEEKLNRRYGIKVAAPKRILRSVIETHVAALLDERTFDLFRKYVDGWDVKLIDILVYSSLTDEECVRVVNSEDFFNISRSVSETIRHYSKEHNPNFTMWEVEVNEDMDMLVVSAVGDYRIEQWHREHGVTQLNVTDTMTIDIEFVHSFLKRVLHYDHAPSNLRLGRKRDLVSKDVYFKGVLHTVIQYALKKTRHTIKAYDDILNELQKLSLIGDVSAVDNSINAFLDYELLNKIEKLNTNRTVSSYVVSGLSLVINFGSRKVKSLEVKHFSELELELAEANGDYVPERQRRK